MVAIDTSSASRKATLTRIVLSALLVVPIGFVGLFHAGSGPLGMSLAIPALYLLWVLGADAISLARREGVYRARPAYKWFVVAGVLVFAMWVGFMMAQKGTV